MAEGNVARDDQEARATSSLRKTVTLGLLTGRFAIDGSDESSAHRRRSNSRPRHPAR